MSRFGLIELLGVLGLTLGFFAWQMWDLNADRRAARRAPSREIKRPKS